MAMQGDRKLHFRVTTEQYTQASQRLEDRGGVGQGGFAKSMLNVFLEDGREVIRDPLPPGACDQTHFTLIQDVTLVSMIKSFPCPKCKVGGKGSCIVQQQPGTLAKDLLYTCGSCGFRTSFPTSSRCPGSGATTPAVVDDGPGNAVHCAYLLDPRSPPGLAALSTACPHLPVSPNRPLHTADVAQARIRLEYAALQ
eukprot:gene4722-4903_t